MVSCRGESISIRKSSRIRTQRWELWEKKLLKLNYSSSMYFGRSKVFCDGIWFDFRAPRWLKRDHMLFIHRRWIAWTVENGDEEQKKEYKTSKKTWWFRSRRKKTEWERLSRYRRCFKTVYSVADSLTSDGRSKKRRDQIGNHRHFCISNQQTYYISPIYHWPVSTTDDQCHPFDAAR